MNSAQEIPYYNPFLQILVLCLNAVASITFLKLLQNLVIQIHLVCCRRRTLRMTRRPPTRQQQLRIVTCISGFIINIIQLPASLVQYQDPIVYKTHSLRFIIPLIEIVFVWIGFYCHVLAVIERYERLGMVIPKSKQEQRFTVIKYACLVLLLASTVGQWVCAIGWTLNNGKPIFCPNWMDIINMFIVASTSALYLIIEITLNLKMVLISIESYKKDVQDSVKKSAVDLDAPVNVQRQIRKVRHYAGLQHRMLACFILLLLFDFTIIGYSVVSRVMFDATGIGIGGLQSALMCPHIVVGYLLLDMFLVWLKEAKNRRFDTCQLDIKHVKLSTDDNNNGLQYQDSIAPFSRTCDTSLE